ncbi:MAG TPA: hypothetical protein VJY33_01080 [Isosphaeraceae bacterium]|nr:hypothetical protein [Isosphaeraceae bacterium]
MTTSDHFGFTPDLQAETRVEYGQDERFEFFLNTATRWGHTVGRRLSATRQWVESEAIGNRPLTTLGIAFGLGVFTGWLVKRH